LIFVIWLRDTATVTRPPEPQAGPGWYPDGPAQRWWDGQSWTEHARPLGDGDTPLPAAAGPGAAPDTTLGDWKPPSTFIIWLNILLFGWFLGVGYAYAVYKAVRGIQAVRGTHVKATRYIVPIALPPLGMLAVIVLVFYLTANPPSHGPAVALPATAASQPTPAAPQTVQPSPAPALTRTADGGLHMAYGPLPHPIIVRAATAEAAPCQGTPAVQSHADPTRPLTAASPDGKTCYALSPVVLEIGSLAGSAAPRPDGNGWQMTLDLAAGDANRLAAYTSKHALSTGASGPASTLCLLVQGRVVLAPIVSEPLPKGQLSIGFPQPDDAKSVFISLTGAA
jgi:hypothetical protein